MSKVVYAKDYQGELLELAIERIMQGHGTQYVYSIEHLQEAVKANKNLRFNINSNVMYRGKEKISWLSNSKDIDKNMSVKDVLKWEMLPWIMNSASRLSRGYEA